MPNRSIERYLALVAAGLVGYKIVSYTDDASRKAEDKTDSPFEPVPIVERQVAGVTNEGRKGKQKDRETQEESYWFWTKWAAVIASVGAIVASAFAGGAFYQAQRQATAAEDANRPWLAITGIKILSLKVTDQTVTVNLEINFKNIGHSPAQNVAWGAKITTSKDENFGPSTGKEICLEQKAYRKLFFLEDVVFPESGLQRRSGIDTRSIKDLIEANQVNLKKYIGQNISNFGNNRAAAAAPFVLRYEMPLELRGCITYLSTEADRSVHATSFSYSLAGKTPSKSGLPFDISVLGTRKEKDLIVSPTDDGVYAD